VINTKYALREMSTNMYNSMLYKKIWGAGVADVRELADIVNNDIRQKNKLTTSQFSELNCN